MKNQALDTTPIDISTALLVSTYPNATNMKKLKCCKFRDHIEISKIWSNKLVKDDKINIDEKFNKKLKLNAERKTQFDNFKKKANNWFLFTVFNFFQFII